MSYLGVNIGALTVKVAALRGDARTATGLAHQGRPLEILDEVLARNLWRTPPHSRQGA